MCLTKICLVPLDFALYLFGISKSIYAMRGQDKRREKYKNEIALC